MTAAIWTVKHKFAHGVIISPRLGNIIQVYMNVKLNFVAFVFAFSHLDMCV